jgi:hypothetical protein
MKSINKLSKKDIEILYSYIYVYHKYISNYYGTFNYNAQEVKKFCLNNDIKKKEYKNTKTKYNYFWFSTYQDNKTKVNDIACHLLRHVRNSIAHVRFIKKRNKQAYYILDDYDNNGIHTMHGVIRVDLFWDFINIILHTSPNIDKDIHF